MFYKQVKSNEHLLNTVYEIKSEIGIYKKITDINKKTYVKTNTIDCTNYNGEKTFK